MTCKDQDAVYWLVAGALMEDERLAIEAHMRRCQDCRREFESLSPVIDSFPSWPSDGVSPSSRLWGRLSQRIAAERRVESVSSEPPSSQPPLSKEPEWETVGPGISCKLLGTDAERHRVSMLVRLAPGAEYPPHTHAALEELHLLDGELWIDERRLFPGDYNRAQAGSSDARVWSETGCTCVLITSTLDVVD